VTAQGRDRAPAWRRRLHTAVLGLWAGILVFFIFAVPAALFSAVSPGQLLRALGALFPAFFLYSSVAGLLAVLTATRRALVLPAAALLLQLLDWFWLVPWTESAVGTARFFTLHGLSLGLAVVALALVAVALVVDVVRPA
jgi:hypothetical protein